MLEQMVGSVFTLLTCIRPCGLPCLPHATLPVIQGAALGPLQRAASESESQERLCINTSKRQPPISQINARLINAVIPASHGAKSVSSGGGGGGLHWVP